MSAGMKNTLHGNRGYEYLQLLKIMLMSWPWIVISTIVALFVAWIYLFCSPAVYSAQASLKFEDNKSEISELLNVKNRFYRQDKIEIEKFIIRSRSVRIQTVKSLNYDISFYNQSHFLLHERYPQIPLKIEIIQKNARFLENKIEFKEVNQDYFQLSYQLKSKQYKKRYKYKTLIALPGLKFKIWGNERPSLYDRVIFKFNSDEELIERIDKGLRVEENKNNGILHLKLSDTNPYFAQHALNTLLQEYLKYDQMQRSTSAVQTIYFIDTLLQNMQKTVIKTGKAIEQFKINNNFIDISSGAESKSLQLAELETEKHKIDVRHIYLGTIEKNIKKNKEVNSLNFNIQGTIDPQLNELLKKFNDLLSEKNEISATYRPTSELILRLDQQLINLRNTILENVGMQIEKNEHNGAYISNQIEILKKSYNSLPTVERAFITLKSAFDVKQKVFNYLSEKKLEAQISKAAAIPSAFIVDHAVLSTEIVCPKPKKTYILALFSGITFGICGLFISRHLNPYIRTKETLERLTDIPIIGMVSHCTKIFGSKRMSFPSLYEPKSEFAESIRSVRTQLNFLASDKESKVICITSDISGEGKSFISVNLACAFGMLEKKVIVIATDLRKSKTHQLLHTNSSKGLSDYLAGSIELEKIIFHTALKNLSFIASGTIPPNPAELLLTSRMEDLLLSLKKEFDLILIDTAPIGLVSDAIPLLKASDINLFVVRSGVSRNKSVEIPLNLRNSYSLSNIYLMMNGFKSDMSYHKYYSGEYYDR